MRLKLGTRGSDLAMTQSRWIASALAGAGIETELVVISTSGDRSDAPTFGAIGPQGVFVREIEQALVESRIDLAVHSFKDLPTQSPDALVVAAVPARRDAADWLFYRGDRERSTASGQSAAETGRALNALRAGARVGTSSARRQAWLRHLRPDLTLAPLRGNVPTRLKRLADGDFDAIILAGAGVERLDEAGDVLASSLAAIERQRLDPAAFVPAPAQGALAVQCRVADASLCRSLAAIDDAATRAVIDVERHALALAEGGCDAAFGAWARPAGTGLVLSLMAERNGQVVSASLEGPADRALAAAALDALAPPARSALR